MEENTGSLFPSRRELDRYRKNYNEASKVLGRSGKFYAVTKETAVGTDMFYEWGTPVDITYILVDNPKISLLNKYGWNVEKGDKKPIICYLPFLDKNGNKIILSEGCLVEIGARESQHGDLNYDIRKFQIVAAETDFEMNMFIANLAPFRNIEKPAEPIPTPEDPINENRFFVRDEVFSDEVTGVYVDVNKLQEKTITPGTTDRVVEADREYYALSKVTVVGDPDLTPSNIKNKVELFGVEGTLYAEYVRAERFVLSDTDISNKYITLSSSLVLEESIIFIHNDTGLLLSLGIDYVLVNSNVVSWEQLEAHSYLKEGDSITIQYRVSPIISDEMKHEVFILSENDIDITKEIVLSGSITREQDTLVFIESIGLVAKYNVDYMINDGHISWSSLGLDGRLKSMDRIRVSYL